MNDNTIKTKKNHKNVIEGHIIKSFLYKINFFGYLFPLQFDPFEIKSIQNFSE